MAWLADPLPAGRRFESGSLDIYARQIIAAAFSCCVAALGPRVYLTHWDGAGWRQVAGASRFGFQDVAVVATAASCALLFVWLSARRVGVQRTVAWTFAGATLLLTAANVVNVRAFEVLGEPLTVPWISFAGDLTSDTTRESVGSAITPEFVLLACGALLGQIALFALALWACRRIGPKRLSGLLAISFALTMLYLVGADHPWKMKSDDRRFAINPLVRLASDLRHAESSDLLHDEGAIPPDRLPLQRNDRAELPADIAGARVRNVIVVVLESVGAKYLPATSSHPEQGALWKYSSNIVRFTDAYAQAGHSTKSLFSLTTGQSQLFSYAQDTEALAKGRFTTLPQVLKQRGYRTAIFMADLHYAHGIDFLRGRGFDEMRDGKRLNCIREINDACIVDAAKNWVASGREPFFTVVWTHDTHYPYSPASSPRPGQYFQDPAQNRYAAAARESEAYVAGLVDWLEKQKLFDSTLLIVVGDHGQAFREHGFTLHSSTVNEEELRIPLLLISGSFSHRSIATIGSISDIPQTILHVLKMPPETSWQSRSLFEKVRPKRLFLFAPQGPVIGYREGETKFIDDISTGEVHKFDLQRDPGETHDLATSGDASRVRHLTAGWMQQQERRFATALAPAPAR